jgi:hypothetical protein
MQRLGNLPATPGGDDAPPPMPASLPPGLDEESASSSDVFDDDADVNGLEPPIPVGELAADDDFQALHGNASRYCRLLFRFFGSWRIIFFVHIVRCVSSTC